MNWFQLFAILESSPLIEYLSDEELIDLAVFIQGTYFNGNGHGGLDLSTHL
jgi:hypothetical protein